MPTAPPDAARRFAADLKAAREARQVGLDRLYQAARIPLDVLQNFERDGLANNRMFNRVYLRSLVRTYADVVGLPVPLVLDALDAALDGQYNGEIQAFLEGRRTTPVAAEPSDAPAVPTDASAPAPPDAPGEPEVVAEPEADATPEPSPAVVSETADAEAEPSAEPPVPEPPPAESLEASVEAVPEVPVEAAPDVPAEAVPATPIVPAAPVAPVIEAAEERPARVRREIAPVPTGGATPYAIPSPDPALAAYEVDRGMPAWAKVALGLLALVLVAGGIFWWTSRDPDAAPRPSVAAPAAPRTAAPADSSATPSAPAAPVSLPDTLHLVVNASGGPLRELRITVDADVRRPYWLEQGTSRTFPFRDSVAITNPPAEATLTVEGRPVPASARRADGTVVLRRSALAAGR